MGEMKKQRDSRQIKLRKEEYDLYCQVTSRWHMLRGSNDTKGIVHPMVNEMLNDMKIKLDMELAKTSSSKFLPPPYYTTTEKVKIKEILNHLGFNLEKENERIIIPQREFKNLISKQFNIIGYRQVQQKFNSILSYLNFSSIKDGVYFYVVNELGLNYLQVQQEQKKKLSTTRKAQIEKLVDDYLIYMEHNPTKDPIAEQKKIQAKLSSKNPNEEEYFYTYKSSKKIFQKPLNKTL